MGQRLTEPLTQGLVNSRDPALLSSGELSEMRNAVYFPNAQGLTRATGRTAFGTVTATARNVIGIRDLTFDNADHYLLAHASAFYSTAVVGDTGTFATSLTTTQGLSLEAIHSDNQYFVLNGTATDLAADSTATNNYVAYLSATATGTTVSWRTHGLSPVRTSPTVATATGTWTAGVTGYYEYWTTEVVEYTKDGVVQQLESTFDGVAPDYKPQPVTVYISATGMQVTVNVPATPTNAAATKWRVYRAGPKELATDVLFPAGFRIGSDFEFASTTAFTDGGATTGTFASATVTASPSTFTTPTNAIGAGDGAWAVGGGISSKLTLGYASFTVNEPILGLEIGITGKRDGNPGCLVAVSNDGGNTYSSDRAVGLSTSNVEVAFIGAANDLWGMNWSAGAVLSTKFRVRITSILSTVSIDSVRVRFTYGGTNAGDQTDVPFPAVIVNQSGLTASIGSHGKPPVADTGDVYEGQLVLNDKANPSFVRYSLPLEPDYFPSIYFVDFETADNDQVTNIKTLNNRLGVFLKNSAYRLNYLPSENDATFDRGRCIDQISPSYGCYNSQCATTYTGADGRTSLAYVSDHGIHTTDLFSVQNLTDDVDWRTIVATASSAPIALINDPDKWELLFYYRNETVSDTEHYRCLHLSYHPRHIKGGQPKLSGQVHMRNYDAGTGVYASLESAWSVKRSSGTYSVYLGYGGTTASATAAGAGMVYRENGTSLPAFNPNLSFITRRMYLAGQGKEFRLNEIYNYMAASGTPAVTYTLYTVKTNDPGGEVTQSTTKSYTHAGGIQHKVQFNQQCEGVRIGMAMTASASAWRDEYLVLDGEGFGQEDSGL
jgi:hypothetical protein